MEQRFITLIEYGYCTQSTWIGIQFQSTCYVHPGSGL